MQLKEEGTEMEERKTGRALRKVCVHTEDNIKYN